MKKLLLIIPLLFGCARDYTCDAGPPCVSELSPTPDDLHTLQALGTDCDIRITVDWPDGKKEAEEICNESYNNDSSYNSCTCEKDN